MARAWWGSRFGEKLLHISSGEGLDFDSGTGGQGGIQAEASETSASLVDTHGRFHATTTNHFLLQGNMDS